MSKFTENNQLVLEDYHAKEFERKHVYEIYDKIADEFSDSRYRAWPNVKKFVEELIPGTILVDLGTGNGKNLDLNEKIVSIGCDTSIKLLEICRKNQFECMAANVLNLPFKDESIDACIFIAVLHHLATEQRRLDALKNIVKMLKAHGECLIYVWAFEQELKGNKSNYIRQKYDCKLEVTKCVPINLGGSASDLNKGNFSSLTELIKDDSNNLDNSKELNEANDFSDAKNLNQLNNQINSTKLMPIHYNGTKFKYQDCFVPWKKKNKVIPLEETDLRFYHLFKEGELDDLIKRLDNVEILDSYYDNGNWAIKFKKI